MNRSFASDNNAGIHPEILSAIERANDGHAKGYGGDEHTAQAEALMQRHFGEESSSFFVFNGTGGNVVALQALLRPYEATICAETAHINVDECGAPERFTGSKLLTLPTPDGKLTPAMIEHHLHGIGVVHHVQPRAISITQSTELGTVYTPGEIRALAEFAHARNLYLHMDGARYCNAAAGLGVDLKALSVDAGVDILTFGGTKNGLMLGEAVVVFRPELAESIGYLRKQSAQLASKMRYISAQFIAYLESDLWRRNAIHANQMAQFLAQQAAQIEGVHLTQPTQANAVFAILPHAAIEKLQAEYFFYVWDPEKNEVRWVCSFDTTEQDVAQFAQALHKALATP